MRHKVKPGARKLLTISAHFRLSLELLMERVFTASPHFVRYMSAIFGRYYLFCATLIIRLPDY